MQLTWLKKLIARQFYFYCWCLFQVWLMVRHSGEHIRKLMMQLVIVHRRDRHQWYDPLHHSCLRRCLRSSRDLYPITPLHGVIRLIHIRTCCRHSPASHRSRLRPRRPWLLYLAVTWRPRPPPRPVLVAVFQPTPAPRPMLHHLTRCTQRLSVRTIRPMSALYAWSGRRTACSICVVICACAILVPSAYIIAPMHRVRYAVNQSSTLSRSTGLNSRHCWPFTSLLLCFCHRPICSAYLSLETVHRFCGRFSQLGVCGWQKNDFGSVCKKLWFLVRFRLYKINGGFGFFSVRLGLHSSVDVDTIFHLRLCGMTLEMTYWIGPTNCQPKWLRTRNAEIRHEEKYVDCWSYHVARWIVNETTWKTIPKPPKSFFENRTAETKFSVFEFWGWFGSVFRKHISDIFIGFRTPLFTMALIDCSAQLV